ncbi:Trans-aconitate 3-methyltransferase [Cladobotryum mycophilum]|uniref:Trans-aconitate 3-methyltransferase n=1 Tax=Cladobotryum mycophilum TaxID=491253 RepID=A0ABR0SVU4_9HYPO
MVELNAESHSPLSMEERTFRSYDQKQGEAYLKGRRDFHPCVYKTALNYHQSRGGQLGTLLDVGCGPGFAARGLASHFTHTIGIDASNGMINTARSLGGVTRTSEPIRFDVSTAEELGSNLSPPILDASVDLITASDAAHWFDPVQFWKAAARVLKPGGTVILWASGEIAAHTSMPNAVAVQSAMDKYVERDLMPYYTPGNLLSRNRYVDLLLPWTLDQPIPAFDQNSFVRKDWDVDDHFVIGEREIDMDTLEKMLATGSVQTRWYQAHPGIVGTEGDALKILRREIERLLQETGVEKGKEMFKRAVWGTMLSVKKKP